MRIMTDHIGPIWSSPPGSRARDTELYTHSLLGQLHTLKILVFLAKSKIGIFACFFRANLTVSGVLVGSAGE
jgi:hypothetical protein